AADRRADAGRHRVACAVRQVRAARRRRDGARAYRDIVRGGGVRKAYATALALLLAACGNAGNGRLQGWVEGDFVFVGPDDAGRVETLNVREGDQVVVGAPLFAIDADLQAADVHTASAQVAEARARLARLESAQQRKEEVAVLQAQERRADSAV